MYLNGYGVPFDMSKAIDYLTLASKDIYAINMCYKTATTHDDPGAHFGLSYMYSEGLGVPDSREISAKHLIKLAELGYIPAVYALGNEHIYSFSAVEQDFNKAEELLMRAAEHDYQPSYYALYNLYTSKTNKKSNMKKALFWLKKSANAGDSFSQLKLAAAYEMGEFVDLDLIEAAKWYYIACVQRKSEQKWLDQIKLKMNSAEIERARNSAQEWLKTEVGSAKLFKGELNIPEL
jgi:TPR repeat protein